MQDWLCGLGGDTYEEVQEYHNTASSTWYFDRLLFFLSNRPEPEEPDANDKIPVLKLNKDDIVKMEIKNESGELTFNKVEKEVEEEKDGKKEKVKKSVWEVDYPYEVTLREIRVDDLAYSFANLEAERIIEEETPDDLSPYGLDNPRLQVRLP